MSDLPARSPALRDRPMIVTFDVDCGELLPGHRFLARGLSGPAVLPLPEPLLEEDDEFRIAADDEPAEEYRRPDQVALDVAGGAGYPGFSLEYELVPGLREGQDLFKALVGIQYDADVPLPWDPGDSGVLAPFEGGSSTHGSRGDWPLPPDARVLTFTLSPPMAAGGAPLGQLVVQLDTEDAQWVPHDAQEQS